MKRIVDLKGVLTTWLITAGLSLVASPFLYFDMGPTDILHAAIFYPLCVASGILYAMMAAKRRPDLTISSLGLGGALAATIPAFIVTVADTSFVLALVFTVFGALFGCMGAVIWAMVDEAKSLKRNRSSDSPRPLPKSRKR